MWCCGVVVITTAQLHSTQVLCRFKPYLWHVGDSQWWGSLTVVQTGNKAICLSLVKKYHKNNSPSSPPCNLGNYVWIYVWWGDLEYLNISVLQQNVIVSSIDPFLYWLLLCGIIFKSYSGMPVFLILKNKHSFMNHDFLNSKDSKPNSL